MYNQVEIETNKFWRVTMERKEYYNLPIEEVIQIFKSNAELGLNSAEVSNRHNEYGKIRWKLNKKPL